MNAKQESSILMNAVLPLAEKMLRLHGEFYPYGGYMTLDGNIVDVGAAVPATDVPKSEELIDILSASLRQIATAGHCKAVALVSDWSVSRPNSDRNGDAIKICLEHVDGYAAQVFLPYQIVRNEVVYGEVFAQESTHEFFV